MAASPSPQPMAVGETIANPTTRPTYASAISGNQQSSEKSLKPVILLHGEPTVVFDSKDLESFIMEEKLKYALIAKFSHGRPELPDLRKILPQQLGFKGECNIGLLESRHVLLRFTLKEDYIAIFSKTGRSIKFAGTVIPFRIQKWTPSFDPREETSIAMAWISFPNLPCQYFARNALFSMASAIGQPLDVDRATYDKTRPSTARVKVEVDLLRTLPRRIRVQFKDLVTGEITNVWQKIKYDYLPYYCKICKRQGHRESDCRTLIKGQVDATVNEDNNEVRKFQGDLRDHLNAKKINLDRSEVGEKDADGTVKEVPQTGELSQQEKITPSPSQQIGNLADHVGVEEQLVVVSNQQINQSKDAQLGQKIKDKKENEVAHDIAENSSENKHTPEKLYDAILMQKSDSQPENLANDTTSQSLDGEGKIAASQCDDDVQPLEVTDLQAEISCSNENAVGNWNIVAPKKSISMGISPSLENRQHVATNLIVPANEGMSSLSQSNVTDDVIIAEGKERETSAPKGADLVDKEEHVAPPPLNSKLSPKAPEFVPNKSISQKSNLENLASGDRPTNAYAIDSDDDFFDEDEEDTMLDICFAKVARDGDISPRHQRSGSNKNEKKTHGRQHSWDGKVSADFVPRHLPMRLAK